MKPSIMPNGNLHNLTDTTGWDFTLLWWNTEQNPCPSSGQESVRKSSAPILDHLAVFADIRQPRNDRMARFDVGHWQPVVIRPWRHLVTAFLWTICVFCTNIGSNVHFKDACHARHRYDPFGPPRTARDP